MDDPTNSPRHVGVRLTSKTAVNRKVPVVAPVQPSVSNLSVVAPLQPSVKNRKAAALAVRAAPPDPAPAADKPIGGKTAATNPKKQKVDKTPKDHSEVLSRPVLSVGSDIEYRLELTAYSEKNPRVYIFGSTSKRYGAKLRSHGESMKKFIESTPNVTKAMALEHLRSLQAQ